MEIDRKTLKALAADTRLDILKSLGKRRKTPSELSKELKLATSTVTEHLDKLEKANLIKREETGHKWIYYALTRKGEDLVKPRYPVQFVLVLSITIIIIVAGTFVLYNYSYSEMPMSGSEDMLSVPSVERSSQISEATKTEEANITNVTNTTNTTQIP